MNRVYHPCHKIKTNLMSSNKWSIGSLLWAIDPVCEWAGCCFFFFPFFSFIFSWEDITRPTVSWQPSAQLCSRHGPHAAPDSVCVNVCVCGCCEADTHQHFREIFLCEVVTWISAWLRLCSHLVRPKMRIGYSYIHGVGSVCISRSRWWKSQVGDEVCFGPTLTGYSRDSAHSRV